MMDAANNAGATLTDEQRAVILDAMRSVSEHADGIKAGCAIDTEWPDADDKAYYDAQVRVLERLGALLSAPMGKGDAWTTEAARDVLAERARQAGAEGFTPTHDDQHDDGVLVCAAIAYAGADTVNYPINEPPDMWPWAREWWKPADDRRNLVKAAALLIAEIERLDRAGGGHADSHA